MSTFDSTVNAGASYWVKDIYQAFLRPGATEKQLVRQSYLASTLLILLGLAMQLITPNVNAIWGWLNSSFAGGLLIPMFVRWYVPHINGYVNTSTCGNG